MPKDTSGLRRGGGRQKGVPNKVTQEVRELAENLLNRPAYFEALQRDLDRRKCAPAVEAMLWHYWKGKPKETVEVSGVNGGPLSLIQRVVVDGRDASD